MAWQVRKNPWSSMGPNSAIQFVSAKGPPSHAQSLRAEVLPTQWIPARRCPSGAPESLTGSASQGDIRRLLRRQPRCLGLGQPRQSTTPARLCEHIMRVTDWPAIPELSTWLETGTFYLAPTGVGSSSVLRLHTAAYPLRQWLRAGTPSEGDACRTRCASKPGCPWQCPGR